MENKIPLALVNEFKMTRVVPFIGSGLSMNAGLPSWHSLLSGLGEDFLDAHDLNYFRDLEILQKAQFLYDRVGRQAVVKKICDILLATSKTSRVHKLLSSLPVKAMITTNWDTLIEDSFRTAQQMHIKPIWKDDQISMVDEDPVLIKLHGTIDDPAGIVFSEDDYYGASSSNLLLSLYVKTLLATSTILLIGYGFGDFDFKLMNTFVKEQLGPMHREVFIFLPNGAQQRVDYLEKRGLRPIVYRDDDKSTAMEAFLSDLSSQVAMTAIGNRERLKIIYRENNSVRSKANGMVIRNHSNLGPLATPSELADADLLGDKEIGGLEIKCAKSWRRLLEEGAKARCIICLNESWMMEYLDKRGPSVVKRLETLRDNIKHYGNKVEVVDVGVPTNINLDIYGEEVCLESKKSGFQLKPYTRVTVTRKRTQIAERIHDFDVAFEEIQKHMLVQAREKFDIENVTLNKYIIHKLDHLISTMRG